MIATSPTQARPCATRSLRECTGVGEAGKVALPDPTRLNLLPYAYGFFPLLLAWLTDSFRAR